MPFITESLKVSPKCHRACPPRNENLRDPPVTNPLLYFAMQSDRHGLVGFGVCPRPCHRGRRHGPFLVQADAHVGDNPEALVRDGDPQPRDVGVLHMLDHVPTRRLDVGNIETTLVENVGKSLDDPVP